MPISTPPLDYGLDRAGTSGISTGPELSIHDWSGQKVACGTVGRICVRGEPCFPGYLLPDGSYDNSAFDCEGWFDTGDLGYLDSDGYIFITGRSKEVINRGGELISPFEVEGAIMSAALSADSPISGKVIEVLAFSARHNVLQEVVAVAIVTPQGEPRVDLRRIHAALRSSLQQVKWPVLVIYMDSLPRRNNKVLRIQLGERLGLPDVDDEMPHLRRHWRATCPPNDTALTVPIPCFPCFVDSSMLRAGVENVMNTDIQHYYRKVSELQLPELVCAPAKLSSPGLSDTFTAEFKERLAKRVDNYMIPEQVHILKEPLPVDEKGKIDDQQVEALLNSKYEAMKTNSMEGKVADVFSQILACHPAALPNDVEFFSLGGDSLRAGRLASSLRIKFGVDIPISLIFGQGSIQTISAYIAEQNHPCSSDTSEDEVTGCITTRSSTDPILMAVQLIPLAFIYPVRRAFQWCTFIVALAYTQEWATNTSVAGRLLNLTLSILFARTIVRLVFPFVGILAKWTIIGRYQEGLYPMWGWYHTRWWLVQKIVSLSGKGLFNMNDLTRSWYYVLMGARIGKRVRLAGASLGEWDLLDIQDDVVLDRCVCRPFAAEGNTSMYLGKIVIGERASVGISSIVAAGAVVPPDTCIGPNSSSWEMQDVHESNRALSPKMARKPHWLLTCLLTGPLRLIAWLLALMPWLGGLVGMVAKQPLGTGAPLRDILNWFTAPRRVAFHYLALVLRCLFAPLILFMFVVIIRFSLDAIFGSLGPCPSHRCDAISAWRADLMRKLMPTSRLHDVTAMFGQHYEATSMALRMLGSKVGKRVYWPGTGPYIGDYHLLNVGNDVVFGSRAHLITSDGVGSEPILIRDRAMVADRVCLLPGVEIGERTTMGSGALTGRGNKYEAGATYMGSKGRDAICLSNGHRKLRTPLQCSSSEETLTDEAITTVGMYNHKLESNESTLCDPNEDRQRRNRFMEHRTIIDRSPPPLPLSDSISPFGRAFYLRLAPYHVMGPVFISCYSTFTILFTALYWNVPNISSIQLVSFIMDRSVSREKGLVYEMSVLFVTSTVTFAILMSLQAILAIGIVVAAKWALLGHRRPGNYDWDKSSYCQRWQAFLCIEKIRRNCYRSEGILGLLTGTNWIVLYFRALGAKIGSDCALFANGNPSLMFTEPDLITLGNRVVVDDASVVGHINARGKFDLNHLEIGDRSVLRTGSRLLSGAKMGHDTCLLEHTLIMGGDLVGEKSTMQGWPAQKHKGRRIS